MTVCGTVCETQEESYAEPLLRSRRRFRPRARAGSRNPAPEVGCVPGDAARGGGEEGSGARRFPEAVAAKSFGGRPRSGHWRTKTTGNGVTLCPGERKYLSGLLSGPREDQC